MPSSDFDATAVLKEQMSIHSEFDEEARASNNSSVLTRKVSNCSILQLNSLSSASGISLLKIILVMFLNFFLET